MTPEQFAEQVRFRTKTSSTTFPDADILRIANIKKDDLCERVEKSDEEYFIVPATADLVADQREYPFPDEVLNIKKVEAKLNGTNWIWLTPFDMGSRDRPTDEATIVSDFSNNEGDAFYDIIRRAIYIYSGVIANVTGGLKAWYHIYPADLPNVTATTDMSKDPTTTSFGIPKPLHSVLLDAVVIEYKQSKDIPIALTERELAWEMKVEQAIEKLRGLNLDESTISALPGASDRHDEGFNL